MLLLVLIAVAARWSWRRKLESFVEAEEGDQIMVVGYSGGEWLLDMLVFRERMLSWREKGVATGLREKC